ncbi:MAG: transporter substrate-binding domain-containing protein [Alphaproteobacteria bacterium]|nr:transporter substrate-binding domain-containing protein [Alphaproteobacteria bacterium]
MGKVTSTFTTVVVAVLVALATSWFVHQPWKTPAAQQTASPQESAYDRVMRMRTIRCGYVVYDNALIKDPNTGKFSGIIYEITELLGKRLNLKIDWTEEVSFGSMIEVLKAGRYDVLCLNGWNSGGYAPLLSQTIPLYFSVLDAYAPEGDVRFDDNLKVANDPSVKIAAIDGTATKVIADQNFPKASQISLPQSSDYVTALMNVSDKKADLAFVERHLASAFMAKNPGKIHLVKTDKPLRYYANGLEMDIGEYKLLAMINMALEEMLGAGDIDAILARYQDTPPSSLPVVRPFAEQAPQAY